MDDDIVPQCQRLYMPKSLADVCCSCIVYCHRVVEHGVLLGIPKSVHRQLLVVAVRAINKSDEAKASMQTLIATWPYSRLQVSEIMPRSLMVDAHMLESIIMKSLLQLRSGCNMESIDFSGENFSNIFILPILSLPPEQQTASYLRCLLHEKCKNITEETENLEAVLSWKLNAIKEIVKDYPCSYKKQGCLDIILDCQLNLAEWLGMDVEILGLVLQGMTPFRVKVNKLSITNFHIRNVDCFKWFLNTIDSQVANHLVVYGHRKSMMLMMWKIHEELKKMKNLRKYVMGTSGPHIPGVLSGKEYPTGEQLIQCTVEVFRSWSNLQELFYVGVVLTNQLGAILAALEKPLCKLQIYACKVSLEDVEYLSTCHHVSNLVELGLEYNNLDGKGHVLTTLVENCKKIDMLNLKETNLKVHEKVDILCALQGSDTLATLAMYENEDMVSSHAYQTMVEMACQIPHLTTFYIFPFNCKPFDVFFRADVEDACKEILIGQNRQDLKLFY